MVLPRVGPTGPQESAANNLSYETYIVGYVRVVFSVVITSPVEKVLLAGQYSKSTEPAVIAHRAQPIVQEGASEASVYQRYVATALPFTVVWPRMRPFSSVWGP